jgi:hypothetical protein
MKRILLVIAITSIFILYLLQHRYSVSSTQELAKLEKQRQLLKEEIIALESKEASVYLFTNLEDTAQQLNLFFPNKNQTVDNSNTFTRLTNNSVRTAESLDFKRYGIKPNPNSSSLTAKGNERQ